MSYVFNLNGNLLCILQASYAYPVTDALEFISGTILYLEIYNGFALLLLALHPLVLLCVLILSKEINAMLKAHSSGLSSCEDFHFR